MHNSLKIRKLILTALFTALAYAAVSVLRFHVQFLTFDLKDAVMTIGAMMLGPASGFAMSLIVALLEFVSFSDTGVYGLIMNALSSTSFVVTSSLIYRSKKTLLGAVIGLVSSIFAMCAVMMLANLLITPYYLGVNVGSVAGTIPTLLLPFNFVKALFNASLTMLLYKPASRALKTVSGLGKFALTEKTNNVQEPIEIQNVRKRTILVSICSCALILVSLIVIFFVMDGNISWFR